MSCSEVLEVVDATRRLIGGIDPDINQQFVAHIAHPTVHVVAHVANPTWLDERCGAEVVHLLSQVQLDESLLTKFGVVDGLEFLVVDPVDVLDRVQPLVDQSVVGAVHGGSNAAAAVVPSHDDMFHLRHFHGELQHRHQVHVGARRDWRCCDG